MIGNLTEDVFEAVFGFLPFPVHICETTHAEFFKELTQALKNISNKSPDFKVIVPPRTRLKK